jgi:hypothetical protein
MNLRQIIRMQDHFVTLLKERNTMEGSQDFDKYADEVYNIVKTAYSKAVGGYPNLHETSLVEESSMWKLVTRSGKVTAVVCYSDKYGGRKSIASASDGTPEGKQDLYKIWKEDISQLDRQAFTECSGKVEYKRIALGAVPVPAKVAQELMPDKLFLEFNEDGFHYTRMIGDEPHEKIMLGNPPK